MTPERLKDIRAGRFLSTRDVFAFIAPFLSARLSFERERRGVSCWKGGRSIGKG